MRSGESLDDLKGHSVHDHAVLPQLPLDVLIIILNLVPISRERCDIGALTLVSCLRVSSTFREAASLPSLWKPHYQIRYEHWDEEREKTRTDAVENNWRLMYAQRREIDRAALQLLDSIVSTRVGRQAVATSLVRQAMDVWDVLELECTCPIPQPFAGDGHLDSLEGQRIPDHAITRRYWAKYLLDTVARGHGVSIWRRFRLTSPPSEQPSFEETMSSLSTFFGVSEKKKTAQLDDLTNRCRQDFNAKGICLDYRDVNYDLPGICRDICYFMRSQGFSRFASAQGHGYLDSDSDILSKFPHGYLTTNKATIPISLVHVFVAIATRFDIQASPINFPGVVLAHVLPRGQNLRSLVVNPSALDPKHAVIDDTTPLNENPPLQMQMFAPSMGAEHLIPCTAPLMLVRAARNISAIYMTLPQINRPEVHPSALVPLCVNLLFQADDNTLQELFSNAKLRPLDCIFLLDDLAPYLQERCKRHTEQTCQMVLDEERAAELRVYKRKPGVPKFFVGMAFIHVQFGYMGFIWGWDEVCKATEAWMLHMKVDSLSRGRHQPFYNIYSVDGTQRCKFAFSDETLC
ncbi:hypothetical protein BDZ97DRAFT_374995 [Flammula alnicola]|nr:hypothetical protein BDZ97DRAFT_374995 [Flammula alnicola]